MAEKVGDAYVELGTRNRGLETGLNRGLKRVQGFAVAASGVIAGIGATIAATRGIGKFIDLAMTQQDAVEGLASALRAYGDDVNALLPSLKKEASAIQRITRFGDEQNLMLMTTLRNLGVQGDAIKSATRDAIGLSVALEMDSKTAARYTALAKQGEFTILQRYVPALRQATTQAEKAAIVNELMARGFNQAKDQALTARGGIEQYKNAAGDLGEQIGFLVMRFVSVDGKVRTFTKSIENLTEKLSGITSAQIKTTREIAMFVTKLGVAYAVGVKLAPIMATLAANVVALAAQGGIAAAVGSVSLFTAAAVGIAAITKKLIEMRHATNQLLESQENLSETLKAQEEKFGTKSTEALRRMRREMQAAGLDTRTGRPVGESGGGGGGGAGQATQQAGRNFAFSSFEDAIRGIQTSLGKDDSEKEQKKQTGFLSNIDRGINAVNESIGKIAVVGA